ADRPRQTQASAVRRSRTVEGPSRASPSVRSVRAMARHAARPRGVLDLGGREDRPARGGPDRLVRDPSGRDLGKRKNRAAISCSLWVFQGAIRVDPPENVAAIRVDPPENVTAIRVDPPENVTGGLELLVGAPQGFAQ